MECKRTKEKQRGAHTVCIARVASEIKREKDRKRESDRTWLPLMFSALHHHQCLTSVAPAWPPRDESITLNNVNVSPSQHKTNNHRFLPRATSARAAFATPGRPPAPFPLLFLFAFIAFRPRRRGLVKKSPLACVNVFATETCFVNDDGCLFFRDLYLHSFLIYEVFVFLAF